jgi:hypothetical protein
LAIAIDAFFDNFCMAALIQRLRIPHAPREIIDWRSPEEFRIRGYDRFE